MAALGNGAYGQQHPRMMERYLLGVARQLWKEGNIKVPAEGEPEPEEGTLDITALLVSGRERGLIENISVKRTNKNLSKADKILNSQRCFVEQKDAFPHAVLLDSECKLPILWPVLSNNLKDKVLFGVTRSKDKIAGVAKDLGFEGLTADGKSKVLYWVPGEKEPKVYDGTLCL